MPINCNNSSLTSSLHLTLYEMAVMKSLSWPVPDYTISVRRHVTCCNECLLNCSSTMLIEKKQMQVEACHHFVTSISATLMFWKCGYKITKLWPLCWHFYAVRNLKREGTNCKAVRDQGKEGNMKFKFLFLAVPWC